MPETAYRNYVLDKLYDIFPGCIILFNDPRHIQGIPDILILYNDKWAMLEVKFTDDAHIQPNQKYYIDILNTMSFASFINPENEGRVFYDLQRALGSNR